MVRVLVTGAFGLVGSDMVLALQEKYGVENVIALAHENMDENYQGVSEWGDVRKAKGLEKIIKKYKINQVYHLAGILSAGSEKQPELAWEVNLLALKGILDLARDYKLKVFWPSSIAAFGPTTPKQNVPQHTVLEPTTMYGVSKVAGELLCQYYFNRYGVDVRSLRYPGLNGYKAAPGDGTTEYAIHIFYGLIKENRYTCFLKEDARLPMMYMDDAIQGTLQLMEAPAESIKVRTSYNFAAVSFTPAELVVEIKKISPDFEIEYKPDMRQKIAEGWPQTIDDSAAREDWGWEHKYGLVGMTRELYEGVKGKVAK